MSRRPWARAFGAVVVMLVSGAFGWAAGLVWFAQSIPEAAVESAPSTDAIVVLTGGANRVKTGLRLLAFGHGRKLFVSARGTGEDGALVVEAKAVFIVVELHHFSRKTAS